MRKFRDLFTVSFWLAVFFLIPILTFKDGILLYFNWYHLIADSTSFPPTIPIVQSIPAALWFWTGPLFSQIKYFSWVCAAIQLGLLGLCCFKASRVRTFYQEQLILAAALILSVVISPLAWKNNYLFTLPAFLLLMERGRVLSMYTAFLLMTLLPAIVGIFSKDWVDRSYFTLLGGLVLFFDCLYMSTRHERDEKCFYLGI